jgi:hypothetical protein
MCQLSSLATTTDVVAEVMLLAEATACAIVRRARAVGERRDVGSGRRCGRVMLCRRTGGDEQLFDKPARDRRPTRDPIAARPGRSVEFA